jgi:hypothetical protein
MKSHADLSPSLVNIIDACAKMELTQPKSNDSVCAKGQQQWKGTMRITIALALLVGSATAAAAQYGRIRHFVM